MRVMEEASNTGNEIRYDSSSQKDFDKHDNNYASGTEHDDSEHDSVGDYNSGGGSSLSGEYNDDEYIDELFERYDRGEQLTEEEIYEVELLERFQQGEELTEDEILDLDHFRDQRIEIHEQEHQIRILLEQQQAGGEWNEEDEDLLYELLLFQRERNGEELTPDENFELELFRKRRQGEELYPEELDDLEQLKQERQQNADEEDELYHLYELRDQGETYDAALLYELELLIRQRKGEEPLTEQEIFHLELLDRQRQGEELIEEELQELDDAIDAMQQQYQQEHESLQNSKSSLAALDDPQLMEAKRKPETATVDTETNMSEDDAVSRAEPSESIQDHKSTNDDNDSPLQNPADNSQQQQQNVSPGDDNEDEEAYETRIIEKNGKIMRLRKKIKKKEPPKELDPIPTVPDTDSQLKAPLGAAATVADKPLPLATPTAPSATAATGTPPKGKEPEKKPEPGRKGLFGGWGFGGGGGGGGPKAKSRKSMELESLRKQQEELIKEQLKALEMDKQLEEEKKKQDALIEEARQKTLLKQQQEAEDSVSSWETDPDWEPMDAVPEPAKDVTASDATQPKTDTKKSSSSKPEVKSAPATTKETSKNVSSKADPPKKNDISSAAKTSAQPKAQNGKTNGKVSNEGDTNVKSDTSKATVPDSKASTKSEKDNLEKDAADSSGAAKAENSKKPTIKPTITITHRKELSPRRNRTSFLSEHLEAQKTKMEKLKLTRYGDEVSVGTRDLQSLNNSTINETKEPKKKKGATFTESAKNKREHPWRSALTVSIEDMVIREGEDHIINNDHQFLENGNATAYFETNKTLFGRSVFNFNESFNSDNGDNNSISLGSIGTATVDQAIMMADDDQTMTEELMQSLIIDGKMFDNLESKLERKKRDKDEEFDKAWEETEFGGNDTMRNRSRGYRKQQDQNKETDDADDAYKYDEVPRLFLFEGEKRRYGKKRKKKKSKKRINKKLETQLSKEFIRAVREIFDDEEEEEEEYNATFTKQPEVLPVLGGKQTTKRGSVVSLSESDYSEAEESGTEEPEIVEDDFLQRLRERSIRDKANKDNNAASANTNKNSDDQSHETGKGSKGSAKTSESSQNDKLLEGGLQDNTRSISSRHLADRSPPLSRQNSSNRSTLGRLRERRGRRSMSPKLDPSQIYEQEKEKQQKANKVFTISDLRKEMEDARRQNFRNTNFSSSGGGGSNKPLLVPKKSARLDGRLEQRGDMDILGLQSKHASGFLLDKQSSFRTAASGQGLLGHRQSSDFDITNGNGEAGNSTSNTNGFPSLRSTGSGGKSFRWAGKGGGGIGPGSNGNLHASPHSTAASKSNESPENFFSDFGTRTPGLPGVVDDEDDDDDNRSNKSGASGKKGLNGLDLLKNKTLKLFAGLKRKKSKQDTFADVNEEEKEDGVGLLG